ncbi:hypothetical protein T4B_10877 [Trichinella pseudospiralis]|uniref:Uncharacterized protein n=1 Tax=Trichinella pseudospiralis TaxID=6337 RepID=A0A0V1JIT3_TRIPS|nr:hypothetical protein T4B_10877 [Trichinella pseudospiralis]
MPIVPVIKDDGSCTVDKTFGKEIYQVPAVNGILATLKKGRIFSKLDLAQTYERSLVDEALADDYNAERSY